MAVRSSLPPSPWDYGRRKTSRDREGAGKTEVYPPKAGWKDGYLILDSGCSMLDTRNKPAVKRQAKYF